MNIHLRKFSYLKIIVFNNILFQLSYLSFSKIVIMNNSNFSLYTIVIFNFSKL